MGEHVTPSLDDHSEMFTAQLGQIFHPFRDIKLPRVSTIRRFESRDNWNRPLPFLKVPVKVEDLQWWIGLAPNNWLDDIRIGSTSGYHSFYDTPLGRVRIVKTFKPGRFPQYNELPLEILLGIDIYSLDQFKRIQQLQAEFLIGENIYKEDWIFSDETVKYDLNKYGKFSLNHSISYLTKGHDLVNVYLPYNTRLLSTIGVRFIHT